MVLDDNLRIAFKELLVDSEDILSDIEKGKTENVLQRVRRTSGMNGFLEDSLKLDFDWIGSLSEQDKLNKEITISSNFPLYQCCNRDNAIFSITYLYPKKNKNLRNMVEFDYCHNEDNTIVLEAFIITTDDKKNKFLEMIEKIHSK